MQVLEPPKKSSWRARPPKSCAISFLGPPKSPIRGIFLCLFADRKTYNKKIKTPQNLKNVAPSRPRDDLLAILGTVLVSFLGKFYRLLQEGIESTNVVKTWRFSMILPSQAPHFGTKCRPKFHNFVDLVFAPLFWTLFRSMMPQKQIC